MRVPNRHALSLDRMFALSRRLFPDEERQRARRLSILSISGFGTNEKSPMARD